MPQALALDIEEQEPKKRYTYKDYLTWPESFRCELINGEIYVDGQLYEGEPPTEEALFGMAAPSTTHQRVLGELHYQLHGFLRNKACQVFPAPFAVRFPSQTEDDTDKIFQPDLVVVCDRSKIDERGCKGAPDFIIEILSPSTATNDLLYKLNIYRNAGVREYWVVDPKRKHIGVYSLENGEYKYAGFDAETTTKLPIGVLPGCVIDLTTVFAPG
ncbi:MAG: Uma2 family endonuclease [Spirochaetaceae bacterium]|jgi:Uma2 family endonuclease|nr:Uma2 family endonuclease [Spirochaetaceae bacterium]